MGHRTDLITTLDSSIYPACIGDAAVSVALKRPTSIPLYLRDRVPGTDAAEEPKNTENHCRRWCGSIAARPECYSFSKITTVSADYI